MKNLREVSSLLIVLCMAVGQAGGALSAGPSSQDDVYSIEEINANGGLIVGDKIYTDFVVLATGLSDNVSVTDFSIDGSHGIQFLMPWFILGEGDEDAQISFNVTVLDEYVDNFIVGASLKQKNYSFTNVENGAIAISENIHRSDDEGNPFSEDPIATLGVFAGVDDGKKTQSTYDEASFYADDEMVLTKSIYVEKDILLSGDGGFTHLSGIGQTFHQFVIPEPFSLALLGLGGVLGLRRQRHQ